MPPSTSPPDDDDDDVSPNPSTTTTRTSSSSAINDSSSTSTNLTKSQARDLYTSHFLSTWNARIYEFAAIIFTAAAFPDTLFFSSVRGIVTTLASICFSSIIGRWIDNSKNRLITLFTTITANRISVVCASVCWFFLVSDGINGESPIGTRSQLGLHGRASEAPIKMPELAKGLMFAAVLSLGVIEKLSGSANMMSMERDWVVTVCGSNDGAMLTKLNSTMRRIDLICKLIAPILISLLISIFGSIRIGVVIVGAMSALSWGVEYWCAKRVWNGNAALRVPKVVPVHDDGADNSQGVMEPGNPYPRFLAKRVQWFRRYFEDFNNYFSCGVWIPSFSLTLLHLSALSYGATFITFLLNYGFSLNLITIARAIGSVVEISSTLVTPVGVERLSKARCDRPVQRDEETESNQPLLDSTGEGPVNATAETQIGLCRFGIWGFTWQFANLIPVVLALWALSSKNLPVHLPGASLLNTFLEKFAPASSSHPALLTTISLFAFLSLSRFGLWIFDLTTQQLTQTLVPSHQRSSFAGVENSFVSVFELGQWVAGMVLSRPEDFKWLAMGSLGAVGISLCMYAGWVWRRRGHLVHWERLSGVLKACECVKMRER